MVRSASVLGQAHTPRRRFLPFVAIAFAVLVAPAVSGAIPAHSTASLRAHDAAIAAKSRAAVLGLYSLDQQLGAAQARLASLRAQSQSLRAERASVAQQQKVARRGARIAQRHLAARFRLLYEQGNVEPLEIVFGAKSLDEALTNLDNLSRVTGQGEDVIRELKAAKKRLAKASRTLATRESALAAATRDAQATAAALATTKAQRTAYISSLAAQRRLTQNQIAALVVEAHAAQVRSAALSRVRAASAAVSSTVVVSSATTFGAPEPVAASSPAGSSATTAPGRTITVSATGYALSGMTATGLPVGWGIVAVDPSVIPLGTHMTIPGYGEAVAADTGGAIVGATIDLWFPTIAQANAWGRRTVTIVLH
jgi:3D (Asp-Asp-Asp) domain-containing protein